MKYSVDRVKIYGKEYEKTLDDIPQLLDWIKKEFGSV